MAYVIGVVLAAGRGVRMGGPKATLVVGGRRLVDRAVDALASGGCDRIIAVVGDDVTVDDAEVIVNPAPERGMRSSLALAVDAAEPGVRDTDLGLAVLLVDTPGIDANAIRAVVDHWRNHPTRIAVGRFETGRQVGPRGHPTVMSVTRWQLALLLAGPDEGARRYLDASSGLIDEVGVNGDPTDLDRPEDLQAWEDRSNPAG